MYVFLITGTIPTPPRPVYSSAPLVGQQPLQAYVDTTGLEHSVSVLCGMRGVRVSEWRRGLAYTRTSTRGERSCSHNTGCIADTHAHPQTSVRDGCYRLPRFL